MNSRELIAALTSFAVCIALTPIVRKLCVHWDAVDRPGPLKIHTHPIPRLGGVAVAVSISASIFAAARSAIHELPLFFASFALVWLMGLADDLRDLPPLVRLAAQTVSGILLWLGGWRFSAAPLFSATGCVSLITVCLLVIVLVNSLNFLDGSDGIAAGVAAIIACAYLLLPHASNFAALSTAVAAGLVGACAAFLISNLPPASVFLGDSGSTVLGFCVALLCLSPPRSNYLSPLTSVLPLLLAGLPLLDFAFTVTRRIRNHASVLRGDRQHFYDQLIARGWSPRRVAFACYGITLALAAVAWIGLQYGLRTFLLLSLFSFAGISALGIRLGVLQPGGAEKTSQLYEIAEARNAGATAKLQ